MNVGVVGNPNYRDLKSLLAHLAQTAPRLGITLFSESTLAALWQVATGREAGAG